MSQEQNSSSIYFPGPDYMWQYDSFRLLDQHKRVKEIMLMGWWVTLREVALATRAPEASVSAQIRHLRKERFGGYVIEKRRRGDPGKGLFEYRINLEATRAKGGQHGNYEYFWF